MIKARRGWAIAALLAALQWCAFLAAQQLNGRASVLDRIEAPLADLRFIAAGARVPPPGLAMVLIDEDTVRWAGQFPLSRDSIATLIRTIKQAGATAIGVDVLFIDPGQPDSDRKLADALHDTGAVIAAAAIFAPPGATGDGPRTREGVPEAHNIIWPMPLFKQVAAVGLANVATDYDGTPRHLPLLTEMAGTLYPSLPLRVASLAAGADPVVSGDRIRIGTATSRLDLGEHLPLRFYGPGGTVPSLSARDILTDPGRAEAFRGKVVVIGAAAAGIGDTFGTPFDPVLPGVEVLATAIGNLITGDGLVRDTWTRRVDAITVFCLPALLLLCLSLNPVALGFGLALLVTLAWIGLNLAAFAAGTWFSLAVPATAALPIVLAYGLDRLWRTQYSERRLAAEKGVLRRFQPAILADRLETEPGFLAQPVTQRAALLFVDLTGFTGLAEAVGPERTQALLGAFHHLVDEVVTEHGGLVLTFMGDGAMAVFGVPDCAPDDAAHAVDAAFALSRRSLAWLGEMAATSPVPVWVKLGAHYGPVVVSRLGGETHQHITVTGDSVNIASRLMATASQHGAVLACSADLVEAARIDGDDRHEFSDTQIVDLRGRSNPMVVRFWSPGDSAHPDLLPEPSM